MYAIINKEGNKFISSGKFKWGNSNKKRLWYKISDVRLSINNAKIPLEEAEIIKYELNETDRFPITQRKVIKKPRFDS